MDLKQIRIALELYFEANNRVYPPSSTGSTNCNATTLAYGLQVLAPTFIAVVPRDPSNATAEGRCYKYAVPSSGAWYHLGASLEDTSHPAVSLDKDCNSGTAGSCGLGTAASGAFSGTDGTSGCISSAQTPSSVCYDVTP